MQHQERQQQQQQRQVLQRHYYTLPTAASFTIAAMTLRFLTIVLVSALLSSLSAHAQLVSPSEPCTEQERLDAQRDHDRCVETVQARQQVFQQVRHPTAHLVALCQRLEEQVDGCGEKLAKCLTASDLRSDDRLLLLLVPLLLLLFLLGSLLLPLDLVVDACYSIVHYVIM